MACTSTRLNGVCIGGGGGGDVTAAGNNAFTGTNSFAANSDFNGTVDLDGASTVSANMTFDNSADITMGSGSQVFFTAGTAANPGLAVNGDATTGFYSVGAGTLDFVSSFGTSARFGVSSFSIGGTSVSLSLAGSGGTPSITFVTANVFNLATGELHQFSTTTAQKYKVYATRTDGSNFERAAINTTAGSLVEFAAETAGTGGDNLDVQLTPAGTGLVRYGTHAAIGAETVTGFITIKDSGGTSRKLAVVS